MKHTLVSPRRVRELSYHPLARAVSFALGVMLASTAAPAFAGPESGQIVEGIGTITQGVDTTLITQGSQTLNIDWQSFNVDAAESVRFDQPTSAAVAINRILDQNPSQIFGAIDANGHVYLLNPNGVVFGATARLNIGSLVASSLDLTRAENGSLEFAANGPAGLVVNRGLIRAATGGSVTLLGGSVANEGLIVADLGRVNLGAGARASLDFDGDGMLFFEVDGDVLTNDSGADAAVSNSGTIQADGGQVLLSARAAQGVFANVVNNEGVIRAARIDNSGGTVRLVGSGAPVMQAGVVDVSGADEASTGGRIEILGEKVGVTAGAQLIADGAAGGGTILVGGDVQGGGTTPTADFAFVGAGATLSADALANGDGGTVVVWAEEVARVYGDLSAQGGAQSGDGGFIETSGKGYLDFGGRVTASAPNGAAGTWLLDPSNVVIDNGATTGIDEVAGATVTFTPTPPGALNTRIKASDIVAALELGSNVTITTTSAAAAAGDITVDAAITKNAGAGATTLMLLADNDITVNDNITASGASGALDVVLRANRNVTINADIDANGGNIAATVDLDEATTNNAATLTIGTGATLTAASIQFDGLADVQDDTLRVLRGGGDTATWTIDGTTGTNAGTVAATDFSATADFFQFGHLTGGDQADTFTFSGVNGTIAGTASGAGGDDDFVVSNGTGAAAFDGGAGASDDLTYAGSTGPVTVAISALPGFENVIGSAHAGDVLQGTSSGDTFTTAGANAGTVGGVTFSLFENLQGVGGNDTFNLGHNVASADGGDDNDTFNLTTGVSTTIAGSAGGTNSDTIVADTTQATQFAITSSGGGSITNGTGTVTFGGLENLTGGGQTDTFTFSAAGALSGTAAGAGGDDDFVVDNGFVSNGTAPATFDGGAHTIGDDVTFAASGLVSVALAELADIENLAGSTSSVQDVLVGTGADETFTTSGSNAGSVVGVLNFSSFENLQGAGGADTFNLDHNITGTAGVDGGADNDIFNFATGVTATVAGGAGTDSLRYATATGPVTVAVGTLATISIEDVVGSGDVQDVLQGSAGNDTFTTSGADAGSVGGVTFASFENLEGLAGNDIFNLGHNITGTAGVQGGADSDTFNLTTNVTANIVGGNGGTNNDRIVADVNVGTDFDVDAPGEGDLTDGSVTLDFTQIESLTGSNQGDLFEISGTGSLAGNILGLGGNDEFRSNGPVVPFSGGSGTNSVNFGPSGTTNIEINLDDYPDVASFAGSPSGDNTLRGTPRADVFTTSGANAGGVTGTTLLGGPLNVTFSFFQNLDGLAGNDIFNLGHLIATSVAGGDDNDTFNLTSGVSTTIAGGDGGSNTDTIIADTTQATQFAITSSGGGSITNGAGNVAFGGVENLAGGDQPDTFAFSAAGALSGTAAGAGGDDDFVLTNGNAAAATFDGGAHSLGDELSFATFVGGAVTVAAGLGTGIEIVTGSPDAQDVLQGTGSGDTFTTSIANAGSVGGRTFSSFENLQGLGGGDTFNLNHNITGTMGVDGGDGDDTFNLASGVTATVAGNTGTGDEIVGAAGTTQFTIDSLNGGSAANGGTITFTGVEDLTGNSASDSFRFTGVGALNGTADGGLGDDDFFVDNGNAGAATFVGGGGASDDLSFAGFAGPVTVAVGVGFSGIETVTGTASSDTLQGTSGNDTFSTSAANNGSVNGSVNFVDFENLQGGLGDDTFNLDHNVTSADGGDDDDIFNFATGVTANVTGGTGTDSQRYTLATGPISVLVATMVANSIEDVRGSASGEDILEGLAGGDVVTTSGTNAGALAAVGTFSSFENLLGGGGDDIFTIDHSITGTVGVDGGPGNDQIRVGNGGLATMTGGTGTDSLRYTSRTGPVTVVSDQILAAGFEDVVGSASGSDILQGSSGADTFTTTGANAGNVGAISFSSFENLQGAAGNDTFTLNHALTSVDGGGDDDIFNIDDGGLAVAIAGGAGTDSQRYCCATGPVTVAVGTLTANSIEEVQGSTSGQDILQGTAGADTFATSGANAGTVAGVTFSSFENLQGATGNDTFNLDHNITGTAGVDGGADNDIFNFATGVTATVAGGAGTDSQRYAGATGPVTIGVGTLTATSIEDVVGSASGQDVLTGTAAAETFATSGANAGTVSGVSFSSFENLQGAGGNDTFNLGHNITGTAGVDGGTENDTFNLTAGVTTTITGGSNTDTIVAANAQATGFAITASNTGTVTNGAGSVGFAGVENLTGGGQADTFTFSGTGALTGTASGQDGADQFVVNNGDTGTALNGGNGSDTLTYAGSTGPVTLVLNVANLIESVLGSPSTQDVLRGTAGADTFATTSTTTVSSGGVTFSGFETFDGSTGADTFNVGHNLGAGTALDGGADGDTFNLTASGGALLRGGAGADRFVFNDGVVVGNVIDGGSEADVLDLRSYSTGRTVSITGTGAVDGFNGTETSAPAGFQNFDEVLGSTAAADTLRGANSNSTWTLTGNTGVYATGGRSLAFTSFNTFESGGAQDAFSLGAGTVNGNLVITDQGSADTLNVAGAVNVTGNVTLTNIETVTDTSGNRITAGTLRITGATNGVGTTNQALLTSVNNLEITGGNSIVVTEQNGLTVSTIDAGTGAVRLTLTVGDLVLGFVRGGNVRLDALDGDILATTAGIHVQGNPVALLTPFGTSGSETNPIVINTPTSGQILIESLSPATISNLNLAEVIATRSSVIDVTVNQGIDVGTLGSSAATQDIAAIDWAGLDPNIALVDCLQPCIRLPADQSEEPGLVELKEATKFLLIRTRDGWKMIPVVVRDPVVAAR